MMAKVTLRNLAAHKIRLVLTAVAVILGVAFVAGTLIFTDSMNRQFDDMFSRIGQSVAVSVRTTDEGGGGRPVPASVVESVKNVEGTENVVGNVTGFAGVLGRDGEMAGPPAEQGVPKLGVNWADDTGFTMTSGRAPRGPAEVALDAATARDAGFGVGDTVQVVTSGPVQRMTVVGLIDTGDLMGASVTAFDTATAQKLLLRPGYFTDLQMESAGPSESELRDRVAAVLPGGFEAITGEQLREETKSEVAQIMGFFRTFMLVFALISVFVGAFIIFNTFSMLVAQRTRELALLRAIGAARPQVTRAVLGEAVAVGVVGSTLGLAAGAGLALALQGVAGMDAALVFTPTPVIWSYAVGIVVTVVSAYFPARRAAKIPPVAAMRDDVALPQRSLRIRVALGSLLAAAGAALIAAGLAGSGNGAVALVGGGAFAVFIGVTMLAPLISVPVVTVLGAPFARLLGAPGRLARRNALRNPRRTAATAAALMIGLALITVVNVLGSTMRTSIEQQIENQFGADYLVQAAGGGISGASVGSDVPATLEKVPGVEDATAIYGGQATFGGEEVQYVAGDAAAVVQAGRLETVAGKAEFGSDGFLVGEGAAKERGWTVGAQVPIRFPDGKTATLRVAGIYAENDLVGGHVLDPRVYLAHTVKPQIGLVVVNAADAGAATTEAIEGALAAYPNLEVSDQAALKDRARGQVDSMVTALTTLLMMSVIIAAVGVVNTLALSVIERTREIGLLRAIGLGRRQLRRMIRVESIVIAVFGAVLGIGIGVAFGAALQNALSDQGLTVLSVPVVTLCVYVAVAAVIGGLAALWPAWRAGRMDVLKAISTE
ncbi:ABC transporter permease [Actinomadura algeriensis]|uniref:ABC transport system permease protein n=1 Tax=Actinomadura algeriensis TaxID=1679523 RepID=A0ABR9K055_9ACTN|nr:ABC transporter permease [Actinomadura algeriensis]MBE1536213.1 putative ABC transport system permease protein [Actinomadura algeriensis]